MDEELCVLTSIYSDDLNVTYDKDTSRPISIRITIFSNGDENDLDHEKRLLCVTLIADLPESYPDLASPIITLCRSRGLTDAQLDKLNSSISSCLDSNRGLCVLYECIELVRSLLSSFELPSEVCAICLSPMYERKDIIKTNCHHFYHINCLTNYIQMKKNELELQYQEAKRNGFFIRNGFLDEIEDPICREILSKNVLEQLLSKQIETNNNNNNNNNNNDDDIDNMTLIKKSFISRSSMATRNECIVSTTKRERRHYRS